MLNIIVPCIVVARSLSVAHRFIEVQVNGGFTNESWHGKHGNTQIETPKCRKSQRGHSRSAGAGHGPQVPPIPCGYGPELATTV